MVYLWCVLWSRVLLFAVRGSRIFSVQNRFSLDRNCNAVLCDFRVQNHILLVYQFVFYQIDLHAILYFFSSLLLYACIWSGAWPHMWSNDKSL